MFIFIPPLSVIESDNMNIFFYIYTFNLIFLS